MSNFKNKNCSELLLTNGMGLDGAPIKFLTLVFLRPPSDHTPAPGETTAATSIELVEVPPPPPAPVQTPPPQDSSMSPPASGGISAPAAGYISPVGVIDDLGYETFTCCGMTFINWFGIDQHKKYSHPAFYIPDDRLLPYIADGFFADK